MTNSLPNEDGRPSSCLGERVVDGVRVAAPAEKCHQELAADGQEPSTVELWICRLREALHETQHNLQLIYRQLQLKQEAQSQQQRQPGICVLLEPLFHSFSVNGHRLVLHLDLFFNNSWEPKSV